MITQRHLRYIRIGIGLALIIACFVLHSLWQEAVSEARRYQKNSDALLDTVEKKTAVLTLTRNELEQYYAKEVEWAEEKGYKTKRIAGLQALVFTLQHTDTNAGIRERFYPVYLPGDTVFRPEHYSYDWTFDFGCFDTRVLFTDTAQTATGKLNGEASVRFIDYRIKPKGYWRRPRMWRIFGGLERWAQDTHAFFDCSDSIKIKANYKLIIKD